MKKYLVLAIVGVALILAGILYHLSTRRVWGFKIYKPTIEAWTSRPFEEMDLSNPMEHFFAYRSIQTTEQWLQCFGSKDLEAKKIYFKTEAALDVELIRQSSILTDANKTTPPIEKQEKLLWSFYYKNINGKLFWFHAIKMYQKPPFILISTKEQGLWKWVLGAHYYGEDILNIGNSGLTKIKLDSNAESKFYTRVYEAINDLEGHKEMPDKKSENLKEEKVSAETKSVKNVSKDVKSKKTPNESDAVSINKEPFKYLLPMRSLFTKLPDEDWMVCFRPIIELSGHGDKPNNDELKLVLKKSMESVIVTQRYDNKDNRAGLVKYRDNLCQLLKVKLDGILNKEYNIQLDKFEFKTFTVQRPL